MKFETDVMKFDTFLTSVNIILTASFCPKQKTSFNMQGSSLRIFAEKYGGWCVVELNTL